MPSRYGGTAAEVRKLANDRGVTVIGFQERSDPPIPKGWKIYQPSRDGRKIREPVAWDNSEWELRGKGTYKISPAKRVQGPFPDQKPRYITWVYLKNRRTGFHIRFGNTHFLFSKQVHSSRRKLWDTQRDNSVKWLKGGERRILVGDFNGGAKNAPMKPMRDAGTMLIAGKKTHRVGFIDHIWVRERRRIKPITATAVGGFKSDHKPLVGTLEGLRR